MKKNQVAIHIRSVPKDLRDKFKGACADRGTNMTDELIDHMRKYVETRNALHNIGHIRRPAGSVSDRTSQISPEGLAGRGLSLL